MLMNKITFSAPNKGSHSATLDYVAKEESEASDDEDYQRAAFEATAATAALRAATERSAAGPGSAAAALRAAHDANNSAIRATLRAANTALADADLLRDAAAKPAGSAASAPARRAATERRSVPPTATTDAGAPADRSAAATTTTAALRATVPGPGLRAADSGTERSGPGSDSVTRTEGDHGTRGGSGSGTERSVTDATAAAADSRSGSGTERSVTDATTATTAAAAAALRAATERSAAGPGSAAAPATDSETRAAGPGSAAAALRAAATPEGDHPSRETGTGSAERRSDAATTPPATERPATERPATERSAAGPGSVTERPGPGTAAAGLRAATTDDDHSNRETGSATDPAVVPTVPAANPGEEKLGEEKLKFLENLARINGYSSFVDLGGILTINHKNDDLTYNYKVFNDAGNYVDVQPSRDNLIKFFNDNEFKLTDEKKYLYRSDVTVNLYGLLPDEIKTKIDSSSSDGFCNKGLKAQKTMEYAVLLSPYSACQHGVTIEQRTAFMENINDIEDHDTKIKLLKFLENLSSNHIAEENKAERNLSFKANDQIYFDYSRGKDVASALQESGRVLAENKFNEFKKKAEVRLNEAASDTPVAPTDYVEFHKIENYFDDKELQGGAGEDGSKNESRTAVVFFHANKKENSQTVISGEAVNKLSEVAKEYSKFIGHSVLNHFDGHTHLNLSRDELLEDLKDNYKQISTGHTIPEPVSTEELLKYLHDDGVKHCIDFNDDKRARFDELLKKSQPEIGNLIVGLTNFKIANDFLECKIESQEQPKNKGLGSPDPTENFVGSNKKIGTDYGETDAKSDLESAFGKKPFCALESQYHSMKNIFQAGISIRRHEDHPHLVDIVRVITPDEDKAEVKKPNIQFVAIKDGKSEGKINLKILKQGSGGIPTSQEIADKVFFRKVELKDDGEVSFDDKIYYYDDAGRQSFEINDITQDANKEAFLNNLGALKIRATCVTLGEDNQPNITKSKFSALGDDNIFKNYNIPKEGGIYTQEIAAAVSPITSYSKRYSGDSRAASTPAFGPRRRSPSPSIGERSRGRSRDISGGRSGGRSGGGGR